MGNQIPFRRCCDGCKEAETEQEPTLTTTSVVAVTPINTSSAPPNLPLISVLRKSSSPPMRHGSTLLSPLLNDQSGLGYDRATPTSNSNSQRIVRIETASPIPFVETNYDDDAETESEDDGRESCASGYSVPPVLPENSSGLRRMLHASQYQTSNTTSSEQRNETKDEDTPASPGYLLRRVERRSSLQSVDVDSPKFAPFPVDKVRQSSISNLLDGTMTLGILVDRAQDDALVQDLLALGWGQSFVCGRSSQEVANFEREVAIRMPDIVVLSSMRFAEEGFEYTACELAHNLRVNGYLGCIIILITASQQDKEEYVDFSKVDGLLEQGPLTRSELKSSIAIALGIAQRRRAAATAPSMPPSQQNSVNSTFAFGSISGGGGGGGDDNDDDDTGKDEDGPPRGTGEHDDD